MSKRVKVQVEVRENVPKFLEAFSNFSGRSPKEIMEEWIESSIQADLDCVHSGFLGLDRKQMKKRYGLQTEGSD
jgi:hypothetical protein